MPEMRGKCKSNPILIYAPGAKLLICLIKNLTTAMNLSEPSSKREWEMSRERERERELTLKRLHVSSV